MHTQPARTATMTSAPPAPWANFAEPAAEPLAERHKAEILAFLWERPLHTVYLTGLVMDNGVVSPLHRGTFYGYRRQDGRLEGVALIGHATLFEARTDAALAAFAALAQKCPRTHMLLGEMDKVEHFWSHYAGGGRAARLICRELLFEQKFPVEVGEPVRGLRKATLADLDLVMPVHAQMAFEESGVNPMEKDPSGFRLRCARRIEQGRVWVLVEDGRLIFKADVVSDTAEVIYLEGIYVNAEERGQGLGRRCLSQLTWTLLARTKTVSLLVNEQNRAASDFYLKAGFKLRAHYDTIFLQQASA